MDLSVQQGRVRAEIDRRMKAVLAHGKYIMGPEIGELEERLASFTDTRHAVTVSSGTDALVIALMALEVGPGDEVITSPFSFIAPVEAIIQVGATPIFVDIDPVTYNIDSAMLEGSISERTRAIIPVSLYGQCADLDQINAIAAQHAVAVVEDGAQSLGATHNGRRSCGVTTIGCTSFFPSKPLGAYGDGGACFTNDDALAQRMREVRVHGQERRYHHVRIGMNGRLDTLQAAVLLAKLEIFDDEVVRRQEAAASYQRLFEMESEGVVGVPRVKPENASAWAQYTVRVPHRDLVQRALAHAGVPTAIHYPVPLHHQPMLYDPKREELLQSVQASEEVLSLPMSAYVPESDQAKVVQALLSAVQECSSG